MKKLGMKVKKMNMTIETNYQAVLILKEFLMIFKI